MHIANGSLNMEAMSDYVCNEAARSLTLLTKIGSTIDAMVLITKQMNATADFFRSHLEKLQTIDGAICEKETVEPLEKAQDSLLSTHNLLCKKLRAARLAPELRPDDGVDDAYEAAIEAVSAVNEEVEAFRWAILEHNADLEKGHAPVVVSDAAGIAAFFSKL